MKWVLIAVLWNTTPPQDSMRFFHALYGAKGDCEAAIQALYSNAFNKGIQAQAVCVSDRELGLGPAY